MKEVVCQKISTENHSAGIISMRNRIRLRFLSNFFQILLHAIIFSMKLTSRLLLNYSIKRKQYNIKKNDCNYFLYI